MMRSVRGMLTGALWLGVVWAVAVGPAGAALVQEKSFDTERLRIKNVVGQVRIEPASGSTFDVAVRIEGRDAREGLVELETGADELTIRMPAGQPSFVYPELGHGSGTRFSGPDGRVEIRGAGGGMELWVDLTVRVPRGGRLALEQRVGAVLAEEVDGELELATGAGDVSIERTTGGLSVATGSGNVLLTRIHGARVDVATGSGDVEALDSEGETLEFATGSGDVKLATLRGDSMKVATGSGDITARGIDSDGCEIGTGSGDVDLGLDGMGGGGFTIGTGSGDITLTLPAGSSADVHAETDGGAIEVALGGDVRYGYRSDEEVEFVVGGGGTRVRLGSGNGDIRIRD